jgi:hypothetical protein
MIKVFVGFQAAGKRENGTHRQMIFMKIRVKKCGV